MSNVKDAFKAGFIEASRWPFPVPADTDSATFDLAFSKWLEVQDTPEPTHYAVIDEHGEIVQAWKIAQYRSAEILCENLIKAMSAHDHDTIEWTVKGVTVRKE